MKLIDISTTKHPNSFAMVDDEDFDYLNQWKWTCWQPPKNRTMYAMRCDHSRDGQRRIYMHRSVLASQSGVLVDHIDANGLNNTKANLRSCDKSQSVWNTRKRASKSTSKFKGVHLESRSGMFIAKIQHRRKRVEIGRFFDEIDAAKAYDNAAKALHGSFANMNFDLVARATTEQEKILEGL